MKVIIVDPIGNKIGLETFHYGYMKELAQHGLQIFYFTNENTRVKTVPNLDLIPAFGSMWQSNNKIKQAFFFLKGLFKIIRYSKKQNIQAIHLHLFEPTIQFLFSILLIKSFTKAKTILSIHDVVSFRRKRRNQSLYRRIVQNVEHVMVYNQYSENLFKEIFPYFNKVSVNPMGYYTDNEILKNKQNLKKSDTHEILFFGQLKKIKGIDLLIKACGLLKKEGMSFRLTIAGKPLDLSENQIYDYLKSCFIDDNTQTYLRFISKEEKDRLFSTADIVVLPYTEIFNSAVLMEAASYKKAVIVSNLPPFTEIITNEKNGLVFKNNNVEDLASVIKKSVSIDSARLGRKLKEHISDNFTWKKHSENLIKIYS